MSEYHQERRRCNRWYTCVEVTQAHFSSKPSKNKHKGITQQPQCTKKFCRLGNTFVILSPTSSGRPRYPAQILWIDRDPSPPRMEVRIATIGSSRWHHSSNHQRPVAKNWPALTRLTVRCRCSDRPCPANSFIVTDRAYHTYLFPFPLPTLYHRSPPVENSTRLDDMSLQGEEDEVWAKRWWSVAQPEAAGELNHLHCAGAMFFNP